MSENPAPNTSLSDSKVSGLYKDWFLDYASYVILERAVPALKDGMKPVQRRILHAMKTMDDGRYHKVANIIGQTMQYHPHGDAAIGDALVNLGQKDLLIDCQGNWGDVRTGDPAAAPRYIEARLTKFALDVLFNGNTTHWQLSYDGRKKEPIHLPAKFPLLLAQGADGIAVGLSTKILPHNFNELCQAAIHHLKGRSFKLLPDFATGGLMDASDYQAGKRGGRIKVRARIEVEDKKTLRIRETPYGTTTQAIIDSIIKANEKGKIRIKKVVDNTAKEVDIEIELPTGVSPDVTIDALYAFTNCEVSLAPNACIIYEDKPHFLSVHDILKLNVEATKNLLQWELEIEKEQIEQKWHLASLEKIFIEQRIYRDIEECETWEAVIAAIDHGMHEYVSTPSRTNKSPSAFSLMRDITEEDILKLTEIKIKRISKFDSFKADEIIQGLEEKLAEVKNHLAQLTEYTIAYFERIKKTYGSEKDRRTELQSFEAIKIKHVAANNVKLYANLKEGFVGMGLKKDTFITDCSDIDDVIAFKKDGSMIISRIEDKKFVGKDILYIAVWKKNEDRRIYHMIYADLTSGKNYVKRFAVTSMVRDKAYQITKSDKAKVLYFAMHPNGESETVRIKLSPNCTARQKEFEYNFTDINVKGRMSAGNVITKYPIRKIDQVSIGPSTFGGKTFFFDSSTGRINGEERGQAIGSFDTSDKVLVIHQNGCYETFHPEVNKKLPLSGIAYIYKWQPSDIVTAVYLDGSSKTEYVKRFHIETKTDDQLFNFIGEHAASKLLFVSLHPEPQVKITVLKSSAKEKSEEVITLSSFIDVKGWKSQGNKFTSDPRRGKVVDVSQTLESKNEKVLSPEENKAPAEKKSPQVGGNLTLDF